MAAITKTRATTIATKSKKLNTIWLAGGGTGGHISPAISIYESLVAKDFNPVLITLEKNKEYPPIKNVSKKKGKNNSEIIFYKASPIPKSLKAIILFIKNIKYSFELLNQESHKRYPDAIVAFGGYPVFPVLLWALLHKVTFYLHEQNVRHGMMTKLFSFKAKNVFLSFPQKKYSTNEILTGNPLRNIFLYYKINHKKTAKKPKRETVQKSKNIPCRKILLLGGSQGASDINQMYHEMCKTDFFKDDIVTVSTGKNDYEQILKISKTSGRKKDQILPFIEDVPKAMMENDFIISRSGSGMIFEILWSQKPACFIPYPHAASDHQRYNALAISNFGHYETIDIRPFDAASAMNKFVWFLSTYSQKGMVLVNNPNEIPLNAHQLITDHLIQDLH